MLEEQNIDAAQPRLHPVPHLAPEDKVPATPAKPTTSTSVAPSKDMHLSPTGVETSGLTWNFSSLIHFTGPLVKPSLVGVNYLL